MTRRSRAYRNPVSDQVYSRASERRASEPSLPNDPTPLSSIHLRSLGRLLGFNLWVVDGGYIRDQIDTDFTSGGNPMRYGYVPMDELWIEGHLSPADMAAIAYHELVETWAMMKLDEDYATAHERATAAEIQVRENEKRPTREEGVAAAVLGWWHRGMAARANPPGPPTWKDLDIYSKQKDLIPILYWTDRWDPNDFIGKARKVLPAVRKKVVSELKKGKVLVTYRGLARCRVCGKALGCSDLHNETHVWPSKAEHYIEEHDVWVPGLEDVVG